MSLLEELKAVVADAMHEAELSNIALSGVVEKIDGLQQLHATDLAETNNPDAQRFIAHVRQAKTDVEALVASLVGAEEAARAYLGYLS